jgi:hypothetical protein
MAPNNDVDFEDRPRVGHPEYAEKPDTKSFENIGSVLDIGQDEIRASVGGTMHSFSDVINNNLIAARYAAVSGVVLLTAYGLSHTPLFSRFRTVSEIPGMFNVYVRLIWV